MPDIGPDDAIRVLLGRAPVTIATNATLREAAEALTEESIGVILVSGAHPGALVSERDIVRALADGADPDAEQVGNVMALDVLSVGPDDVIAEVTARMLDSEIRHAPVVEDEHVIGVISTRDLLAVAAGRG
ncbi:MAG: CBS domain-containing protein [Acidimicrobiia bacterium]|mgnify:CR=1 FL=1|nr:CBS domain-containing protein [Acidimicrobiia bacterium]MCL4293882.1 CBS domain-containing protein [Acidimicrobiia bacterium]